jgi:oligoribonuclease NrnB/cAMP/cGMP phosphodiesterase (DHH superfamily)
LYREIISTQEIGQIIISDLGLNDDMIDLFKEIIIFLKANLWSMIWIDHHPWSEKQ